MVKNNFDMDRRRLGGGHPVCINLRYPRSVYNLKRTP